MRMSQTDHPADISDTLMSFVLYVFCDVLGKWVPYVRVEYVSSFWTNRLGGTKKVRVNRPGQAGSAA